MAAPTWVSLGPVRASDNAYPTATLTFTTGDLPSGIAYGDRLIAIVHTTCYEGQYGSLTMPTDWTLDNRAGEAGAVFNLATYLSVASARWVPGVALGDFTVTVTGLSASLYGNTTWGRLCAISPSFAAGGTFIGRGDNTPRTFGGYARTETVVAPTANPIAVTGEGIVLCVTGVSATNSGTLVSVNTANGFTDVHATGNVGDYRVAVREFTSSASFNPGHPTYNKTHSTGGAAGWFCATSYEVPDPLWAPRSRWRIGKLTLGPMGGTLL